MGTPVTAVVTPGASAAPTRFIVTWQRTNDGYGMLGWDTVQQAFPSLVEACAAVARPFPARTVMATVDDWTTGAPHQVAARRRRRRLVSAGGPWPDQPGENQPKSDGMTGYPRRDWDSAAQWLLDTKADRLSEWEHSFLATLCSRRCITSESQWRVLDRIWRAVGISAEWVTRHTP
jgi:hypothetical protein